MSRSRKHYTKDFKDQISNLYSSGKTILELSSEYGIPASTISKWCQQYTKVINNGDEQISLDDYKKLKKENSRLKLEIEILKKATAIFAKEN